MFDIASLALYASTPNHVFGQMLGLPGSLVLLPYVHPDEHLSRESRKLTVMIKRETGQPLDDLEESSRFLRINEGTFPGQAHTHPEFGERGAPRGYSVAPLSNSYG